MTLSAAKERAHAPEIDLGLASRAPLKNQQTPHFGVSVEAFAAPNAFSMQSPIVRKDAFAKSDNGLYRVKGLQREYDLLKLLSETGVTPQPLGLMIQEGGRKGILFKEYLPGKTFEDNGGIDKDPSQFFPTLGKTLAAIAKIHHYNFLIGDVDKGTFLIDSEGRVRVIDLDFAHHVSELDDPEVQKNLRYQYSADWRNFRNWGSPGSLHIDKYVGEIEEEFLSARLVFGHFIGSVEPFLEISNRQERLDKLTRVIRERGVDNISPTLLSTLSEYFDPQLDKRLASKKVLV